MPPSSSVLCSALKGQGDRLSHRLGLMSKLISKATVVNVSNVAKYYYQHEKDTWKESDFPTVAPPWNLFFMEYEEPTHLFREGSLEEINARSQCGVLALSFPVPEKNKEAVAIQFVASSIGFRVSNLTPENIEIVREYSKKSKWILFCDHFVSSPSTKGRAIWMPVPAFTFIDEKGNSIAHARLPLFSEEFDTEPVGREATHGIVMLSLSFVNCKNVVVSETNEFNASDKWHRRMKCPSIKYKVLDIGPMQEVLRTEGQSEVVGLKKAFHVCRGHFATYTEDNPLFGRTTGTFWKPQHVRGNREHGEVVKDYSVSTENDGETHG